VSLTILLVNVDIKLYCFVAQISINDKFATLSEALYIAERAAREEIRVRNELVKHKKEQEELLREQQLRDLAAKARAERTSVLNKKDVTLSSNASSADNFLSNDKEVEKRMEIEQNRRREIERDIRLEVCGVSAKKRI
jgi:SNW domain-containing protein 1